MSIKHVATAIALLFLLAITWRVAQSDWARGLAAEPAKPAAPIQFDNGTVRQYDSAASVAARNKGQPLPLGTLRKCQRGAEISYTNSFCPAGTQELKVNKGTLTVLAPSPPAAAAARAPAASADRAAPTLRDLAVQRAVQP